MTVYKVGDRVKIKSGKNHDDMTKDKSGTVEEIGTEALGIKFDGMDMVHKWYVDEEVESAAAAGSTHRPDSPVQAIDTAEIYRRWNGQTAAKEK